MATNCTPMKNTDRELWREIDGYYYSPRIFVTAQGSIGIDVGGFCIVKPIREWHKLAWPQHSWRDTGYDRQCTECGAIDCSSGGESWCPGKGV